MIDTNFKTNVQKVMPKQLSNSFYEHFESKVRTHYLLYDCIVGTSNPEFFDNIKF